MTGSIGLVEHDELVATIKKLPGISLLRLWTPEQGFFLKGKQKYWTHLGERIDYLQKLQLGFRPSQPVFKNEIHHLLQKQVEVVGDYLFWMLQVIIEGFDDVKAFALSKNREFLFDDPRQLFAQMCNELSSVEVEKILSEEIGAGKTLTQIRSDQSLTGKFLRFSLPAEEEAELCSLLEKSGFWYGFAIAAIINTSRRYLKKATTQRGITWKKFKEAHKEMHRFCNAKCEGNGSLSTVIWNKGYPVHSQSGKPIEVLNLS